MIPHVKCPQCKEEEPMTDVLTAQSNQNVIYHCHNCNYTQRDIKTKKG
jgi:uncharacterized Zn finger protein